MMKNFERSSFYFRTPEKHQKAHFIFIFSIDFNSPETFVHKIFDGARRSYSDTIFVGDCRPIDASILCLEHIDEIADVVRNRPEDKLALFITARQWTNDIRQPPDVVNGNVWKNNENNR